VDEGHRLSDRSNRRDPRLNCIVSVQFIIIEYKGLRLYDNIVIIEAFKAQISAITMK
jgi:hypothetical protein